MNENELVELIDKYMGNDGLTLSAFEWDKNTNIASE